MTYSVFIEPTASDDLKSIYKYIALELLSVQNAKGQLERLMNGIKSLRQMPGRYRLYDREPWKSRNTRIMTIDNYLVLYFINTNESAVNIIRVLYGGRDIDNILNE